MEIENKEGKSNDYIFKNKRYYLHYSEREEYNLWEIALSWIKKNEKILEIGCGTGQFGHMAADNNRKYTGIDFSPIAINVANKLKKDNNLKIEFILADARNRKNYKNDYDVFICFSTLEHIKNDKDVIRNIPVNKKLIFIVPNFKDIYHVRIFRNENEIYERYNDLIDIKKIKKEKIMESYDFLVKAIKK